MATTSFITRETLRVELDCFARNVFREELGKLKNQLIEEFVAAQYSGNSSGSTFAGQETPPGNVNGPFVRQETPPGMDRRASIVRTRESCRRGSIRHDYTMVSAGTTEKRQHDIESHAQQHSLRICSQHVAQNTHFINFIIGSILASLVVFTVQTDYMARHWSHSPPRVFFILDCAFQIVFTVEICIRICAHQVEFFSGPEQFTNLFDLSLVVLQGAEILFIQSAQSKQEGEFVSSLRALRISRILRIGRILHLLPAMHMLVVSIVSSLRSLLWILVLVLLTTGSFAVVLTQIVTDHKADVGREQVEDHQRELEYFFGNVVQSTFSLYQTISDGRHWAGLAEPLMSYCSPWTGVILVVHSAFVTFALMNVVTAFFVETAMSDAQEDVLVQVSSALWDVFLTTLKEGEGEITEREFMAYINVPAMTAYFDKLDIDADKAIDMHFFKLIDLDDSGSVTAKELIRGCTKLMGNAKAIEVAALIREVREECKKNEIHREQITTMLWSLRSGPFPRTCASAADHAPRLQL